MIIDCLGACVTICPQLGGGYTFALKLDFCGGDCEFFCCTIES